MVLPPLAARVPPAGQKTLPAGTDSRPTFAQISLRSPSADSCQARRSDEATVHHRPNAALRSAVRPRTGQVQ